MWEPPVVTGPHIQPCSYLVQSQHGQLRRNRRHIYKTNEAPPLFAPIDGTAAVRYTPHASVASPEQPRDVPEAALPEPVTIQETQSARDRFTRSGRLVKTPVRYQLTVLCRKHSAPLLEWQRLWSFNREQFCVNRFNGPLSFILVKYGGCNICAPLNATKNCCEES